VAQPNRIRIPAIMLLAVYLVSLCACAQADPFAMFSPQSNGRAIYVDNRQYGIVDADGNALTEPIYDVIWPYEYHVALVEKDGLMGAIDENGSAVLPTIYDLVIIDTIPEMPYFQICLDGKWGTAYIDGSEWVAPEWEDLVGFNNGYAVIVKNGLSGLMNMDMEVVCEPVWDWMQYPVDGYCRVETFCSGKLQQGFIDTEGRLLGGRLWDFVSCFNEERAVVTLDDVESLINTNGDIIAQDFQAYGWQYNDGLLLIIENNQFGYMDISGDIVIAAQYDSAGDFSCGRAVVEEDGYYGFIDTQGNTIFPIRLKKAYDYINDFAIIELHDGYAFLTLSGDYLNDEIYEDWHYFFEGLAAVKKNGLWGYIDTSGQLVIDYQHGDADSFQNGWATVTPLGYSLYDSQVYWFIDREGNLFFEGYTAY